MMNRGRFQISWQAHQVTCAWLRRGHVVQQASWAFDEGQWAEVLPQMAQWMDSHSMSKVCELTVGAPWVQWLVVTWPMHGVRSSDFTAWVQHQVDTQLASWSGSSGWKVVFSPRAKPGESVLVAAMDQAHLHTWKSGLQGLNKRLVRVFPRVFAPSVLARSELASSVLLSSTAEPQTMENGARLAMDEMSGLWLLGFVESNWLTLLAGSKGFSLASSQVLAVRALSMNTDESSIHEAWVHFGRSLGIEFKCVADVGCKDTWVDRWRRWMHVNLDWVARPPLFTGVRLWLFGVSVCALVGLGYGLHQQRVLNQVNEDIQTTQRHIAQAQPPVQPPVDESTRLFVRQQLAALSQIHRALNKNLGLFEHLEGCVSSDWAFLSVKPVGDQSGVQIFAETRDAKTLSTGLACLQDGVVFKQVLLVSQQRVVEDVQRPLRVELLGQLANVAVEGASGATATTVGKESR